MSEERTIYGPIVSKEDSEFVSQFLNRDSSTEYIITQKAKTMAQILGSDRCAANRFDYQCSTCKELLSEDQVDVDMPTQEQIDNKFTGMKCHQVFQKFHLDHQGNRCGPVDQVCYS